MSTSNNSMSAHDSRYLQSLVDYVLDVKPFRTKLAKTGAVSEEYVFADVMNLTFTDSHDIRIFLGADLMPSSATPSSRARLSSSWVQDIVSDGIRRTWPIPNITVPKYSSHACREKFEVGVDDYAGIAGLTSGVFDQRRWDFMGITDVRVNDEHQQDSSDYFLSHGVFTFDVLGLDDDDSKPYWKRNDLIAAEADVRGAVINKELGELRYDDVKRLGGSLVNIIGETYEEFYAVCISEYVPAVMVDDVVVTPAIPSVIEVYSPNATNALGTVSCGDTFTLLEGANTRIEFTYTFAEGHVTDEAKIGDRYEIVPAGKITVSPTAIPQKWSLIKVNPIRLTQKPTWTASPSAQVRQHGDPCLEVHVASIEFSPASEWEVLFAGDGTFSLTAWAPGKASMLAGYPKTLSLADGCSFKDENVAFTIIPTVDGFNADDKFEWVIGKNLAQYKVFGSVSGWTTDITTELDAEVGKLFYNGQIAFKIPKLQMFTDAYHASISTAVFADSQIDGLVTKTVISDWQDRLLDRIVLTDIQFKNGVFLGIGEGKIELASVDGAVWTDNIASIYTPASSTDVVVIPSYSGRVAVTADGSTYDIVPVGGNVINATTVAKNFFSTGDYPDVHVAVGDGGTIASSASGLSWIRHTSGTNQDLNHVIWTGSSFIAVGMNGTILRSINRVVWTEVQAADPSLPDLNSVVSAAGVLYAVGSNASIFKSKNDGLTWLNLNPFPTTITDFTDIAYGDGKFVVSGTSGVNAMLIKGDEGEEVWETYTGKSLNAIEFGAGVFVGVGGSKTDAENFSASTDGTAVSTMAEPSTYTIKFTKSSNYALGIPGEATVFNNILGYGKNLKTDQLWSDQWVKFSLNTAAGYDYTVGDVVHVYLTDSVAYPQDMVAYANAIGYDTNVYDIIGYDGGVDIGRNARTPRAINSELFPLFHSHGAVIFQEQLTVDDVITIDKAFEEKISIEIESASTRFPELGAVNDRIPLYFKYSDYVEAANDFDTTSTKPADFSDIAPFIEAFSSASGQRVFYIRSPRFATTNRASQSVLTFDSQFFNTYLAYNTHYTIFASPQDTYGQTVRVKMAEALQIDVKPVAQS